MKDNYNFPPHGGSFHLSKWYRRMIRSCYIQPSILSNILCRVIYVDQRRRKKGKIGEERHVEMTLVIESLDFFSLDARNEWTSPWTGRKREKTGGWLRDGFRLTSSRWDRIEWTSWRRPGIRYRGLYGGCVHVEIRWRRWMEWKKRRGRGVEKMKEEEEEKKRDRNERRDKIFSKKSNLDERRRTGRCEKESKSK